MSTEGRHGFCPYVGGFYVSRSALLQPCLVAAPWITSCALPFVIEWGSYWRLHVPSASCVLLSSAVFVLIRFMSLHARILNMLQYISRHKDDQMLWSAGQKWLSFTSKWRQHVYARNLVAKTKQCISFKDARFWAYVCRSAAEFVTPLRAAFDVWILSASRAFYGNKSVNGLRFGFMSDQNGSMYG